MERKQTKTEQLEQSIIADIATEAATINGAKQGTAIAPTMDDARLLAVQAGLTEFRAMASERDEALKRAEKAEAEIANLLNLADQAREGERMRLKEVSDKAISEARAAVTQQEVLQGEIEHLRTKIANTDLRAYEAQAEATKYKTLALMIRASLDKILPDEANAQK